MALFGAVFERVLDPAADASAVFYGCRSDDGDRSDDQERAASVMAGKDRDASVAIGQSDFPHRRGQYQSAISVDHIVLDLDHRAARAVLSEEPNGQSAAGGRAKLGRGATDGNSRQPCLSADICGQQCACSARWNSDCSPLVGIQPEIGSIIMKGFVAAILGGFNSLLGCVVGGLILGVLETFGGAFIGGTFKDVTAFVVADGRLVVPAERNFRKGRGATCLNSSETHVTIWRLHRRFDCAGVRFAAVLWLLLSLRRGPCAHQRHHCDWIEHPDWQCRPDFDVPGVVHGDRCLFDDLLLHQIRHQLLDRVATRTACLALLCGFAVGFPALRLRGFYLAVATLGFLEFSQILIENLPSITGGVRGMSSPRPVIFGTKLSSDLYFYYVILVISLVGIWCAHSLLKSPTGRAFNAIRNSEAAAQTSAIPLARTKLIAFVISSFYAGIGGGLYASLVGFIDPLEFSLLTSVRHIIFITVGGLGSVTGSVIGAMLSLSSRTAARIQGVQ